MRKLLVAILAVTLVGFAPSNAVSKAGSKCAKVNTTTTVDGIKYRCIKSGGKLVWDKGIAIKKIAALKQGVCPYVSAGDKNPGITQSRANTLLTMSESDAENCASVLGWGFRVGQRDDEDFPLTLDYLVDRVTITVQKGVVTKVFIG